MPLQSRPQFARASRALQVLPGSWAPNDGNKCGLAGELSSRPVSQPASQLDGRFYGHDRDRDQCDDVRALMRRRPLWAALRAGARARWQPFSVAVIQSRLATSVRLFVRAPAIKLKLTLMGSLSKASADEAEEEEEEEEEEKLASNKDDDHSQSRLEAPLPLPKGCRRLLGSRERKRARESERALARKILINYMVAQFWWSRRKPSSKSA